jgi:hypothetical protein
MQIFRRGKTSKKQEAGEEKTVAFPNCSRPSLYSLTTEGRAQRTGSQRPKISERKPGNEAISASMPFSHGKTKEAK